MIQEEQKIEKDSFYYKVRNLYIDKIKRESTFDVLYEEYTGDPKRYQGNKRTSFKQYRSRFFQGELGPGALFNELVRVGHDAEIV